MSGEYEELDLETLKLLDKIVKDYEELDARIQAASDKLHEEHLKTIEALKRENSNGQ